MKVIRIKGQMSKRISIEIRKGQWRAWEATFGAEADILDGENWKEEAKKLDTELKKMVSDSLQPNGGGGSNQTSNAGHFGANATMADRYRS